MGAKRKGCNCLASVIYVSSSEAQQVGNRATKDAMPAASVPLERKVFHPLEHRFITQRRYLQLAIRHCNLCCKGRLAVALRWGLPKSIRGRQIAKMCTMAWLLYDPSEEDEAMKLMRLIVMIATLFAGTLLMAAQCEYPYGTESTYTLTPYGWWQW